MTEEFPNQTAFEAMPNVYRYAILFAQDCEPKVIYADDKGDQPTNTFSALALMVAEVIEVRRQLAEAQGRDFYAGAFAEQAAHCYNKGGTALDDLLAAGQAESDSIAS